jgi:hypothetical protein
MTVILNTFIAIVEQGFLKTKKMSRFAWLKNQHEDEDGDPEENKEDGVAIENDSKRFIADDMSMKSQSMRAPSMSFD